MPDRSLPPAALRVGPAARWALCALAWLGGVALQLQQPALWPPGTSWSGSAFAVLTCAASWRWRASWPAVLLWMACAAGAGFASTTLRAGALLADRLQPALEGQDLLVTGLVDEMPRIGSSGTRFVFSTEHATLRGQPVAVPRQLALGWYRERDDEAALSGATETLRAGQRWQLPLRLRQVHGTLNPHGFDLELALFERGIGGSGTVRSRADGAAQKLAENAGTFGHQIERLRQRARDAIVQRVADPGAAGVLAALAIGDQAAIDRDGWDLFRITGVAHLMSISGLHVTMFAWLAGAVVGRLWRLQPRLMLLCPAPLAARWGGLFAAASYAMLAGWGVPAQRTVWMIALVVLLRSAGLRWPLHAVLLAAAWLVTLADPWALLQPGFWLSFMAVALLVASEPVAGPALPPVATWPARLRATLQGGLRTQAIATVGLAPLSLVFFQQLSLVGFAANLLAIPLVTLLITPLALLGMLLPPLWLLAAWLVQGLTWLLHGLAAWPMALWTAAAAPPWAMACGLLAGALAVLPLPWRLRALALPLLLPLLWPPLSRPAPGQFELVAADIGQGTAVLVRTHKHLLLFDTGPQYSAEADAGGRVLLPLLRARGETRIDTLVLSHRDSDHVGGAATLMAALPVGLLSSSLEDTHGLLRQAAQAGVPLQRCAAGQSWLWDGVRFDVLHPLPGAYDTAAKPNTISCVVRVQGSNDGSADTGNDSGNDSSNDSRNDGRNSSHNNSRNNSALLTGDIEAPQEAALVQRAGAALASGVMTVPHHGSRTSSTAAFITAVQPQVAVVQAAYRSRFGHPAPDVVGRYAERNVAVVRSDSCGAWTMHSGAAPAASAAGTGNATNATNATNAINAAANPASAVNDVDAINTSGAPSAIHASCERQTARRYWHHRVQPDPAP